MKGTSQKKERVEEKRCVNLYKTRWVARIQAYESFRDLLSALVAICNAHAEVVTAKNALLQIRSDIEVQNKKWFDYAVTLRIKH